MQTQAAPACRRSFISPAAVPDAVRQPLSSTSRFAKQYRNLTRPAAAARDASNDAGREPR